MTRSTPTSNRPPSIAHPAPGGPNRGPKPAPPSPPGPAAGPWADGRHHALAALHRPTSPGIERYRAIIGHYVSLGYDLASPRDLGMRAGVLALGWADRWREGPPAPPDPDQAEALAARALDLGGEYSGLDPTVAEERQQIELALIRDALGLMASGSDWGACAVTLLRRGAPWGIATHPEWPIEDVSVAEDIHLVASICGLRATLRDLRDPEGDRLDLFQVVLTRPSTFELGGPVSRRDVPPPPSPSPRTRRRPAMPLEPSHAHGSRP